MRKRTQMVASVIQETLAPAIARLSTDQFGPITVTLVEVNDDLSLATVWVSSLRDAEALPQYLKRSMPTFHALLCRKLTTYALPSLRFRWDDSGKIAERIDHLLQKSQTNERQETRSRQRQGKDP